MNQDLFNIGTTNNLDKAKQSFYPSELLAHTQIEESDQICKKLHKRYSEVRLPGSDYFRLSKKQVLDCKSILKDSGRSDYFEPIFKGLVSVLTFLLFWFGLTFAIVIFGIEPIFNRLSL